MSSANYLARVSVTPRDMFIQPFNASIETLMLRKMAAILQTTFPYFFRMEEAWEHVESEHNEKRVQIFNTHVWSLTAELRMICTCAGSVFRFSIIV